MRDLTTYRQLLAELALLNIQLTVYKAILADGIVPIKDCPTLEDVDPEDKISIEQVRKEHILATLKLTLLLPKVKAEVERQNIEQDIFRYDIIYYCRLISLGELGYDITDNMTPEEMFGGIL